jgi:hypothetical protein
MAITSQDGLIAALATSQAINWQKSAARTSSWWMSLFDLAGGQGAGVLAGTSTSAGVVPDDTTQGCPPINSFGGSNTGYLAGVQFGASLACRLQVADMLFKAGPYNWNATSVGLTSQPSYVGRLPGGDYKGTQIWLETVSTFTGSGQNVTIGYTNQDNVSKTTTYNTGIVPAIGRMVQVPLAAGDTGVKSVDTVTSSGPSSGTFNVLVLRPLWQGRCSGSNVGGAHGPDLTDMPILYDTSALIVQVFPDSGVMPTVEVRLTIANG